MIDHKTLKTSLIVVPITAAAAALFSLRDNLASSPVVQAASTALSALRALLNEPGIVGLSFAAILFMAAVRTQLFIRVAKQELPVLPPSLNLPIRI